MTRVEIAILFILEHNNYKNNGEYVKFWGNPRKHLGNF